MNQKDDGKKLRSNKVCGLAILLYIDRRITKSLRELF